MLHVQATTSHVEVLLLCETLDRHVMDVCYFAWFHFCFNKQNKLFLLFPSVPWHLKLSKCVLIIMEKHLFFFYSICGSSSGTWACFSSTHGVCQRHVAIKWRDTWRQDIMCSMAFSVVTMSLCVSVCVFDILTCFSFRGCCVLTNALLCDVVTCTWRGTFTGHVSACLFMLTCGCS